jgi:hypothetical protein
MNIERYGACQGLFIYAFPNFQPAFQTISEIPSIAVKSGDRSLLHRKLNKTRAIQILAGKMRTARKEMESVSVLAGPGTLGNPHTVDPSAQLTRTVPPTALVETLSAWILVMALVGLMRSVEHSIIENNVIVSLCFCILEIAKKFRLVFK